MSIIPPPVVQMSTLASPTSTVADRPAAVEQQSQLSAHVVQQPSEQKVQQQVQQHSNIAQSTFRTINASNQNHTQSTPVQQLQVRQSPATPAMSPPAGTSNAASPYDSMNMSGGSFSMNQMHQQQAQQQASAAVLAHHSSHHSSQPSLNSAVYTATYSGVAVFEMMANGVAVMRRRHDSSLNATQILKVAGVEKSKRTKVLEKEILTGEHEKVQGGYGKYQGTWIPFQRALDLCRQYSVTDILAPLLMIDPNSAASQNTPTKEQAMAARRKQSLYHLPSISEMFAQPLQVTGSQSPALSQSASQALSSLGGGVNSTGGGSASGGGASGGPARKRMKSITASPLSTNDKIKNESTLSGTFAGRSLSNVTIADSPAGGAPHAGQSLLKGSNDGTGVNTSESNNSEQDAQVASASNGQNENRVLTVTAIGEGEQPPIDDSNVTDSPIPDEPLAYGSTSTYEQSKEQVVQLFLDSNSREGQSITTILSQIKDIDVPIDDMGHSALHWASALARISLVRDLVKNGANTRRATSAGESALVRAVLVTNNYDNSTFPELLDVLFPAIPLIDKQGRTLLHHIALTAGIKGRAEAARYYLETFLEWIVKRGSRSRMSLFSLGWFMNAMVNARDRNGDTALNIAARVGSRNIVEQLLEVNANIAIPNRAGLRPMDFGINVESAEQHRQLAQQHYYENGQQLPNGHGNGATTGAASHSAAYLAARAAVSVGMNGSSPAMVSTTPDTNSTRDGALDNNVTKALDPKEQHQQIVNTISEKIASIEEDFNQELAEKQNILDELRSQLQQATAKMTELNMEHSKIQQYSRQLIEWQRGSQNLERAVETEDRNFREEEQRQGRDGNVGLNFEGNFDADQPFRIFSLTEENLSRVGQVPPEQLFPDLPPYLIIKARVKAYKANQSKLKWLASDLRSRSTALEQKFRRVVSLCTGVEEDRVDSLLGKLVQAVESDPGEVDISRVSGFLRKIDKV